MVGLYLAARLVIMLFAFQRLYLGFREHDAVFGRLFFQGAQALLHGSQAVAQPDGAYTGRRNKHTFFPQFVAGPDLPMRRASYCKVYYRQFRGLFHTVSARYALVLFCTWVRTNLFLLALAFRWVESVYIRLPSTSRFFMAKKTISSKIS